MTYDVTLYRTGGRFGFKDFIRVTICQREMLLCDKETLHYKMQYEYEYTTQNK